MGGAATRSGEARTWAMVVMVGLGWVREDEVATVVRLVNPLAQPLRALDDPLRRRLPARLDPLRRAPIVQRPVDHLARLELGSFLDAQLARCGRRRRLLTRLLLRLLLGLLLISRIKQHAGAAQRLAHPALLVLGVEEQGADAVAAQRQHPLDAPLERPGA